MTVRDYIKQKFQTFGIKLSEADILDITLNNSLEGGEEITSQNMRSVSVAMARFIPSLLLRPASISESGFSVSFDVNGIKEYYSFLCSKYGLKDELNPKPEITFL